MLQLHGDATELAADEFGNVGSNLCCINEVPCIKMGTPLFTDHELKFQTNAQHYFPTARVFDGCQDM